jgi:hypothetical protein
VAGAAIVWLRAQAPLSGATLTSQLRSAPAAIPVRVTLPAKNRGGSAADSYVTPRPAHTAPVVVPSMELANYVVAHSVFSSPVARRNLLSAFMTSEPPAAGAEEPTDDVKSDAQ